VSASQARQIWWDRVDRAVKRRGNVGRRLTLEWSHGIMETQCAEALQFELVDGDGRPLPPLRFGDEPGAKRGGWKPIPAERFAPEYIERECERLHDKLGADLAVGPYPR
jgi:hypothetical protein